MSADDGKEPIDSALWTGRQPKPCNEAHAFQLVVDYSKEVTVAQVQSIDDLLRSEFETGDWVEIESAQ